MARSGPTEPTSNRQTPSAGLSRSVGHRIVSEVGTWTGHHQDQLRSTRLLTNRTGVTVGSATYDPYGQLTASSGKLSPLGFAGEYTDAETGVSYLRARYYDPGAGQFLTRDPLGPTAGHPYPYVDGNPWNGLTQAACRNGGTRLPGSSAGAPGGTSTRERPSASMDH
jgi:RHS repeat-associated protein